MKVETQVNKKHLTIFCSLSRMSANCDISDNKIRVEPLLGNVAIPSAISEQEHRLISRNQEGRKGGVWS